MTSVGRRRTAPRRDHPAAPSRALTPPTISGAECTYRQGQAKPPGSLLGSESALPLLTDRRRGVTPIGKQQHCSAGTIPRLRIRRLTLASLGGAA